MPACREDQGVGTVRDRDRCELSVAYGKPLLARSQKWCERLADGRAGSMPSSNGLSRNWNWQRRKREIERSRASAFLGAAYELFAAKGIGQVGIETILAKSGCAKASLYSNFDSKVDLAIAFLDRREAVWTRGWLETEIRRRASTPEQRLLTIFDVFDGWFRKKTFEGCSFINVLLESEADSPVRRAAGIHLSKIRAIIRDLAKEARLRDPEKFAQAWHMLMKGSIVSACEGNRNAARDAKRAARLIIEGWARNPTVIRAR